MEKTSNCLASLSPSLPTAYDNPFLEAAQKCTDLRDYMDWLTDRVLAAEQNVDDHIELNHHLMDGLYRRTMLAKEGTMVVGGVHKKACLVFLQAGTISVVTEHGASTLTGPLVFESGPSARRVGFCHTDVVWSNIFAVTGTNLDDIEDELFSLE